MNEQKQYVSPETHEDVDTLEDSGCTLVLYNDDVHSFDYVIKALVDICRSDLLPMHSALLDKQLTTEIQE